MFSIFVSVGLAGAVSCTTAGSAVSENFRRAAMQNFLTFLPQSIRLWVGRWSARTFFFLFPRRIARHVCGCGCGCVILPHRVFVAQLVRLQHFVELSAGL